MALNLHKPQLSGDFGSLSARALPVMESSLSVRVRVAVVIAFMVVVPLAAVTGVRIRGPWGTSEQFDEPASTSVSRPSRPWTAERQNPKRIDGTQHVPVALPDSSLKPGVEDTPGANRFDQIQAELKGLGATYLLLDATTIGDRQYRYCCDIPADSLKKALRFEAFHADPLTAMERVVQQVQAYLRESRSEDAVQSCP
jgi:hypothetical protein